MDLRQLRYFVEIVEQSSLTRAAARLNVAQPALSIHLRNMEAELGTELVIRSHSGVSVTEAGQMLLAHARRMLAEQESVENDIRNLGTEPAGQVRLGLPGTIGAVLTVPLIEAAQKLYPKIRITVSEAMSGFVVNWLREGQIDFAIIYSELSERGLRSDAILREEIFAIAPPGKLKGSRLDLPSFRGFPFILPSRGHGLRALIDGRFELHGQAPDVAIEIDSYSSIKALVARGHGISLLPLHAIGDEMEKGLMKALPVGPEPLQRNVLLGYHSSKPMTRCQSVIHDLIRELMTEMALDGRWPGALLAHENM